MTSPSKGTRVRIRETAFVDGDVTRHFEGTVEDVFFRPDWGQLAYVVMFDHDDDWLPPGGEFSLDRLQVLAAA